MLYKLVVGETVLCTSKDVDGLVTLAYMYANHHRVSVCVKDSADKIIQLCEPTEL